MVCGFFAFSGFDFWFSRFFVFIDIVVILFSLDLMDFGVFWFFFGFDLISLFFLRSCFCLFCPHGFLIFMLIFLLRFLWSTLFCSFISRCYTRCEISAVWTWWPITVSLGVKQILLRFCLALILWILIIFLTLIWSYVGLDSAFFVFLIPIRSDLLWSFFLILDFCET